MQRQSSFGAAGGNNNTKVKITSSSGTEMRSHNLNNQQQQQHQLQQQRTSLPLYHYQLQNQTQNQRFSVPSSVSLTPYSYNDENAEIAIEDRLYLTRLTLEYQQLIDRYGLCLTQFQESANESEILRRENLKLRMTIIELNKRLTLQNRYISSGFSNVSSLTDGFNGLCIGGGGGDNGIGGFSGEISVTSPTSVIGSNNISSSSNRYEKRSVDQRVTLPKSISVRSNGYLKSKMSQADQNQANRFHVGTPVMDGTRVYVPGENKEQDALEFDVYNQGMFKTELCNKWQETGACPYSDQCQFAHGIGELRPVIRHPRYKTEVCRMVLMGDMCPYGHRCHFRHALTEEEKFLSGGVST
ncbi:hypothetical protein GIB67_028867 [Kingdonia uniflora]|uniref:C3H1-type domain-containing protein n=1 Tax=Kingdonia uniflora TaxID=39325 RepID=A0A7J7LTL2_9MAGN|nr:hypothetical protein GIB67_028867 [Kingdonia uniflora]